MDGRRRVIVEGVSPEVDGGRAPLKCVEGDDLIVEADVFVDGHDLVVAFLRHRGPGGAVVETAMTPLGNDRFRATIRPTVLGRHSFTVVGMVDTFGSWRRDLEKRGKAGQDVTVDLEIGARLVDARLASADELDAARLRAWLAVVRDPRGDAANKLLTALDVDAAAAALRAASREHATTYPIENTFVVERERAVYGAWYELFPRSARDDGRHGTFADVERLLPRVASMGFDVLYLPPIHPIGRTFRKGPDNSTEAGPDDPGSPWAIGAAEGGHESVHPELGTLEDLRHLRDAAANLGIELALDIAFQCSPDHPWVTQHPEWFTARPDGTIQYAENPPKKYQDIYPFAFDGEAWSPLWDALRGVVLHWAAEGIRIFRVDNPHTKPIPFWEWLIREVQAKHPDTLFLAEAFTRPNVTYALGKAGFSQSYTYFTWRSDKASIVKYMKELTSSPVRDVFRPAFWPNTPDILTEELQVGGRAVFLARATLAATLSATWGVYGPAFELLESTPLRPGSEEYARSEKYEIRRWSRDSADSIAPFLTRLNRIRRAHPALQRNDSLRFHDVDNDQLVAYSKSIAGGDLLLTVVNLDPHHKHSGVVDLPLSLFGLETEQAFQAHDLITDARYLWRGGKAYVELDPEASPAHVFALRRRVRTEHDFEYFL